VTSRRFGVSSHLFHEHRLDREHLVHIAAHGFEAVEVFATRSHFDYRSDAAIASLGEWLSETGLDLHSMHAPAFEAYRHGRWVGAFSNASSDDTRRRAALAEAEAALAVARKIPFRYLVVHLGMPVVEGPNASKDNQRDAARRSVEDLVVMAARVNVEVAIEVIPNPLSSAAGLCQLIEEDLDGANVGVCLDYGHAHLMGDVGEAIETLSGHLWTTHVHDNAGTRDEHLVPFAGTIDWDAAMMGTQKIGYDGVLMLEVADTGDPVDVLRRSVKARERLERTFVTF
jgi:sugar phosphate isomerase/epimerase